MGLEIKRRRLATRKSWQTLGKKKSFRIGSKNLGLREGLAKLQLGQTQAAQESLGIKRLWLQMGLEIKRRRLASRKSWQTQPSFFGAHHNMRSTTKNLSACSLNKTK